MSSFYIFFALKLAVHYFIRTFACEMSKLNIIYIGIGSNLPEGEQMLLWARQRLAEVLGGEQHYSTILRTEPIDFPSPQPFTNQVARVATSLSAEDVQRKLKSLEREAGRKPKDKAHGIVRLDLDLLCFNGRVLKTEDWHRQDIVSARKELD